MVTQYGMSSNLGPMTYGTDDEEVFVGRDFGRTRNYRKKQRAIIDRDESLIDKAYNKAEELLKENINKLTG